MSYGQHIKRSRHGSLVFRYKVPADVVPLLGCGELTLGMGTACKREAVIRAAFLKTLVLTLVSQARNMTDNLHQRLDLDVEHPDPKAANLWQHRPPPRVDLSRVLRQHLDDYLHNVVAKAMPSLRNEPAEPGIASAKTPTRVAEDDIAGQVRSLRHLIEKLPTQVFGERANEPAIAMVDDIAELRRMRRMQGLQMEAGQMPISELFKDYCDSHRTKWKNWADRKYRDYDPVRDLLIDELGGDLPIERLTVDHVGRFARRVKLDGEAKGSASATMKKRVDYFKAVLNWAKKQVLLPDIAGPLHMEKENESYEAFTEDELRRMFECEHYRKHTFQRDSQFWLPLLGLYSGARVNELASVRLEHIRTVNGVLGIELSPGGRKTGKNEHSRRFLPLHPALIACGFDRYLQVLRDEGRDVLFPCLPDAKRDGKGKYGSDDFIEFRQSLGIGSMPGEGRGTKVFHSFRSTLTTQMQNAGVPSYLRKEIEGHASRDTHDRVYSQGQTPQSILLDALSEARFDFEHPVWQDTDDYRYARLHGRVRPMLTSRADIAA